MKAKVNINVENKRKLILNDLECGDWFTFLNDGDFVYVKVSGTNNFCLLNEKGGLVLQAGNYSHHSVKLVKSAEINIVV